jgi:hypothetical protein
VAYDLLRGAGEMLAAMAASQSKLQEFTGHLYQQSTTPLGRSASVPTSKTTTP